jgi:acyl carrier protein
VKNLREKVLTILADELAEPGQPLNVHVPISQLGADSLDAVALQIEIEIALDIKFPDGEDFTEHLTPMQIYDLVVAKVGVA